MTRQLKARGFTSDQAEAITEAVRAGVTGGVATKADLAELRGEMSARFAQIESKPSRTVLRRIRAVRHRGRPGDRHRRPARRKGRKDLRLR